jgi:hypothetical protein
VRAHRILRAVRRRSEEHSAVQIAVQQEDALPCGPAAERSAAAGSTALPSTCRSPVSTPRTPSRRLPRRIWNTLIHDFEQVIRLATAWGPAWRSYDEVDPCLAFLKSEPAVCRAEDARCFSARIYNPMRLRTSAGLTLTTAMPGTALEATLRCELRLDGRAFHDVQFIANRDDITTTVDGRLCETLPLERRCVAADDYLCTALSIGLPGQSRPAHRLKVFQRRAAEV